MKLSIISSEIIKPSSKPTDIPKKLCLFDQLTPTTYPGILIFYSIKDSNFDVPKTLTSLKKALSETLTIFYPFSGRTKENQYVDEFNSGVPFIAARANLRVSEYFTEINKDAESLNDLVPYKPFRKETRSSDPLIALQVTVFLCGGIALGISLCHKLSDGASVSHFLKTWAEIHSGRGIRVSVPNPSGAAEIFPPLEKVPENTLALLDTMWFMKSNYVTRRFAFNREAINEIKAVASSKAVQNPTRNEAVSCFIWKHVMGASWRASGGSVKTSVAAHAVSLRERARTRDLSDCIGNVFWWAGAASNTAPMEEIEVSHLLALTREIMTDFNEEYVEGMVGPDGFEPISEYLGQLDAMLSADSEKPDILGFTNWSGFFDAVDFGWGKPIWVGAHGKVGDEFRNLVVLIDKPGIKREIEAFVTLEEKLMAELERDDKFLSFASAPVVPTTYDELAFKSRL